jgi:hypothetical protein
MCTNRQSCYVVQDHWITLGIFLVYQLDEKDNNSGYISTVDCKFDVGYLGLRAFPKYDRTIKELGS